MNYRRKISDIVNRKNTDSCGLWLGDPHIDTESSYLKQLGLSDFEDFRLMQKDECRHVFADLGYKHPENKPMFDTHMGIKRHSLSDGGCFSECNDISEVHMYPWPKLEYLDFTEVIKMIRAKNDYAVFSGFWNCFFHIVADFFGMENYFIKMYTDPEIVDAVTSYVIDFLAEANERFLREAGDCFDVVFMGNDLGTQRDLIISPELLRRFFLPGLKKLITVAKKYNKKVMIHSCGSIYKIIPDLIDLGVDCLHPLQAQATNMDAKTLAREFKNDLAFMGGIDTQHLLVKGTPKDIKEEVYRIRELLGPNLIISPSHESILPNVPIENVIAMAQATRE